MDARPATAAFPGPVHHPDPSRADTELARDARAHLDAHPGVRFLADVVAALHAGRDAVRSAAAFYETFPPRVVMDALERRADLRARLVHALTGGPLTLLRRMPPGDLAAQLELLEAEDLPPEERDVRDEADRTLTVVEIYRKYVEPTDACAYLPGHALWQYESADAWWERGSDASRRLMAAELKSLRRHRVLSDSELVDRIGNEVLERDLPLRVRTAIRAASRRAALDGRAFTDTDLFDCVRSDDGQHDLIDEIVAAVSLAHLRQLIARAAEVLGLTAVPASAPVPATVATPVVAATPATPAPASSPTPVAATTPTPATPSPASLAPPPLPTNTAPTPSVAPAAAPAAARSAFPSIPPAASTPAVSPRPSVRPAAAPESPVATAKPTTPSVRPAASTAAPTTRMSELPAVELVDDETFGHETTNSGDKPLAIEPLSDATDVDSTAKLEAARGNPTRR